MESWISLSGTHPEAWPVCSLVEGEEAPQVLNPPLQVRYCLQGSRGQTWGWCALRAAEPQPHSLGLNSYHCLVLCQECGVPGSRAGPVPSHGCSELWDNGQVCGTVPVRCWVLPSSNAVVG